MSDRKSITFPYPTLTHLTRSRLQIPVRPSFPVRQGHMVRTPTNAGAAQGGVVVTTVETAGTLMVNGFAIVTAATATATAAAGTRTCILVVATPGRRCRLRRRRRRRLMVLLLLLLMSLMAMIVHIIASVTTATAD